MAVYDPGSLPYRGHMGTTGGYMTLVRYRIGVIWRYMALVHDRIGVM